MTVKEDFDLTNYNSYRIQARCQRAFFPESTEDLYEMFSRGHQDLIILGRGNNLILSKEYYDRDFLILSDSFSKIEIVDNQISALAGTNMFDLSIAAYNKALTGFEYFYDIPSSLGGAIVMNAGSNGVEIKEFLKSITTISTLTGEITSLTKENIGLTYRSSIFQNRSDILVLSGTFELKRDNRDQIFSRMKEIKERRDSKQPKEYPNAGSVFKRPEGRFVGPMIEALGLKGYMIGGAQVSDKHAGFIINKNNATGKDVLELIQYIQESVKSEYGISLEVEQRII